VGDLEHVPGRVTHHRPVIAVRRVEGRLHRGRRGVDGPAKCRIGVVDVHVQEGREQVALAGPRLHDQRVTDVELGGAAWLDGALRVEDCPEELDLDGDVAHDEARG
jgi:hypothetical protein